MTITELVLDPTAAHRLGTDVLGALGMPADDASIATDALLWAALQGRTTHGLVRLDKIAQAVRAGELSMVVDWAPIHEYGGTTVLDAGNGCGYVAAERGMRLALTKAKRFGVGITSVRHCGRDTGALSWPTSLALDEKMIGLAITNGYPLMVALGGAAKILGNQAFSIATPAGRHSPMVLDTGLGAESLGPLLKAAASGAPVAPGLIVNAQGEPTTDAKAWLDGGGLVPVGGRRGYGLALMWEVLTGILAGGDLPSDRINERFANSLFLMAIDPAAFLDLDEYLERVDQLIDDMHASPRAPGIERIRVPGEGRDSLAERQSRTGITLPADDVRKLRALTEGLGVGWPD
jgi:LDH2 family malate/lactate/ureidoglycolate dehydrogenase